MVELDQLSSRKGILEYFTTVRKRMEASGRVQFYLGASYLPQEDTIVSQAGRKLRVNYQKRVRTAFNVVVPSMRPPPFETADEVRTVPVSALADAPPAKVYVVVGAGKTAVDAILHLLRHKSVEADEITWVAPRPAWYFVREAIFAHNGRNIFNMRREFADALAAPSVTAFMLRWSAEASVLVSTPPQSQRSFVGRLSRETTSSCCGACAPSCAVVSLRSTGVGLGWRVEPLIRSI